ncbi:ACP S-malonyltransferase [Candidatus Dependentiae bacterium]|nr:ACP S-malonyltransferase [Candidatus Dependentiae bacterium]
MRYVPGEVKKKIGMIFPGQGTQFVGMGKELYDQERIVQEIFEEASLCLDINFVQMCFASSEKILKETINSQTAIFVVSAAIYKLLREKYGIVPDLVAGHSLGEYSAIHAVGGLNFPDTLYLLNKRAAIMDRYIKEQNGSMLAVLGFSEEKLRIICAQYDQPENNEHVAEIANYNSSSQIVVSGTTVELQHVKSDVEIMRGKAVMLPVEGAFHSRLLREAENLFSKYLVKVDFKPLEIPLINNIMAQKIQTPVEIKLSLVRQTSSHIYWWQSMQYFKDMDIIIEVGPNDKFAKMLRREWPDKQIFSINSTQDIVRLLDALNN